MPAKGSGTVVGLRRNVRGVWLRERHIVAIQAAVVHAERVTRGTDDAFDEIDRGVGRPFEDDDVAVSRVTPGRESEAREWDSRAEDHFVDDEEVADEQGALHGGRGDFEHLHDERAGHQEEGDRGCEAC